MFSLCMASLIIVSFLQQLMSKLEAQLYLGNAYYALPATLASRAIEFFSFDQRGWGRSAPEKYQRGLSGGTSQIMADIDELLAFRLEARPNIPCFLVGHSMGGGIALTYALQGSHRGRLAGTVVWSPMLELADKPLGLVVGAGKLGAMIFPNKQTIQKLPPAYMSRDPTVCDEFANDPVGRSFLPDKHN